MQKTNKIILDASALLALLKKESGHSIVEENLANAVMSAINISEVIAVLLAIEIPKNETLTIINGLISEIIPFDQHQALMAAELRKITKQHGLSLGDRACLALAKEKKLPVITADKIWNKLDLGITIHVIR